MNNSPANVAGGGRVGVDLKRLLPCCLRFLSAFLVVGTALAATNVSAQGRVYFNMPESPSAVTEGDAATFTVCPPDSSLASAEVEVSETGNMIDGTPPTTVDFTGPGLCVDLAVPTTNDEIGEDDSVITAEILCPDRAKRNADGGCDAAGAAYLPGVFRSNLRKITVEDNDGGATPPPPPTMPEVTIAAGTSPVTEGTAAEFTLTRTGDTAAALTVMVTVSETESTISGTPPTTVDFAADSATATLSVATENDSTDEPDSMVTAAIGAGTGYTAGTPSSATVTVTDDDEPPADVPSVTIAADAASVVEGTAAEFTLTRTISTDALTVTVAVGETGSTISGTAPTTVDFAAGSDTATLSVATENDSLDEQDSTVTAAVSAGAGYAVGSPGSATVTVTDDDEAVDDGDAPTVYFNMAATEIVEGDNATFVLFRQSTDAITVNVEVKETGDTIKGTAPVTVEFAADATRAELVVETDNDDVEEVDSVITATILDGAGYDPGLYGSDVAEITVVDNDGPGDGTDPDDGTDPGDVDPDLASAPLGLEPTPGDHAVMLVWQPPASDGGSAITGYEVRVDGGEWMPTDTMSSHTVMNLDNRRVLDDDTLDGPPYMFELRAVNAAGGGAVATTSATPLGPDIEVSIAADMDAVTEGADAVFTLTRIFNPLGEGEGLDHLVDVDVMVTVVESGATISQAPMTVRMNAREPTATLTVTTEDDMLDEADSEITAEVVDMYAPGYRVDDDPARRTAAIDVMDDDDPPTATIADAMAMEESGEIMFTISLDSPSGKEITVDWATGDDESAGMYDMAVADTDYMASSGSVVFMPQTPASSGGQAGETEHVIVVPVTDDMLDEHAETFTVSISAAEDAPVMIAEGEMAVGTIEDDDEPPSVTIADMSGDESEDLVFAVTLDAPSGLPIVLDVMTGDVETPDDPYGMATAGDDYTAIAVGDTTVEFVPEAAGMAGPVEGTVTVAVVDDALDEHDEVFGVTLTPQMADYVMIDNDMATGTIMDNDDPPTVSIADGSAAEMDGEVTFAVTLSAPSGLPISVNYATGDMETPEDMYGMAMADVDYTSGTGMVEFAPGETEMMVTVAVMDDALDEHDEVFAVTLSDASYATIDDGMATGTIMDDDDPPSVSIADASGSEGSGEVTFTVSLDAPSALPTSVAWATGDMETPDDMYGMAMADVDYASASGTVEFAPGETEMMVTVTVMDDALDEHDEVFAVTLSDASYAMIGDGMATGTITDDDDAPMFNIADASAAEGAGQLVFDVSLDAPSGLPTSVDWSTGDITVPEGSYTMAMADVDYMSAGGTVEFAAGETEMTVTVMVIEDALDEKDEQFAVTLLNPMYGTFAGDAEAVTAIGTIMDDDDAPGVSVADASGPEASGDLTFMVSLDAPSGLPTSVDWATGDSAAGDMYDMAMADVDYMSGTGTVEFAAGETEMMVNVTMIDDALDERNEMFTVTLSNAMYTTIVDGEATGTIEDDDETPTLSIADASGNEAAGQLMFGVTLSAPSGLPVSADYATVAGTAMPGEDYETTSGTLDIAPGETSATVAVTIVADDVHEAEEMFSVELSGAMYSTIDDGSAIGTITDDDPPPTLAIGDSTASESAGQMTFSVTKTGPTALPATVSWATSNGSATAGEDYANSSGSLTFAPGETSMTISVAIMADDRYEGAETFTVTLSGSSNSTLADASATGTITDDDAESVVQAWLARFGRTVASHVVDAVGGRLTEEPVEASVAQLRLGGYQVGGTSDGVWGGPSRLSMAGQRPGAIGDPLFNPVGDRGLNPRIDPTFGQAWGGGTQGPWVGSRNNDFGNLLSRSSFHFSAAGSNPGDSFALWGRGAMTSFSGDDGALSHDGDVTTGTVGVDFETGETLFGIGMSHSQGDGEFAGSGTGLAGGNLDSSLTMFHPYVRVNLNECTSIWGLVGTGSGDLTLTNGAGGATIDTDIEMTMGAAGFRGPLEVGLGDFGLEVKSDIFLASMSADSAPGLDSVDADASRARVALQGSNTTELEGGGLFTPIFEAGLRYDGGDAETGAGVEIGGGLRFADASRRVSLQLNARALLAHSESEYEEWGLGASVVVHPNASGQGVTFNLRSAWGEVASGVDAMWSRYDAAALVNRGERSLARRIGARYDAELGYGLNAPGGRNVLVPYVAAGVSDIGTRDYRLGLRLRSDANMDLRFEVDRREGLGFEPDHGVVLRGWLFW